MVEIGAGYGRLCRAFPPAAYLGVDINAEAIERARSENPEYAFRTVRFVDEYEPADLYLAYTVLLHIDDATIPEIMRRLCAATRVLVIAEILGRRWRQEGATPSFSRERGEYAALAAEHGFVLDEEIRRPYHYYNGSEISCLIFRRKSPAPVMITSFPSDLADPYLDFNGLYEDGWTDRETSITLSQPVGATELVIDGLLPAIDDPMLTSELRVWVDEASVIEQTLRPGAFEVRMPITTPAGAHRVTMSFSRPQRLPPPDTRVVGALLSSVGFRSLDRNARAPH